MIAGKTLVKNQTPKLRNTAILSYLEKSKLGLSMQI